jgi:hypothetical protein
MDYLIGSRHSPATLFDSITYVLLDVNVSLLFQYTWNAALEGLSPSFENLKSLSLQTIFYFPASILNILCVVRNAPKLEFLEIEV